MVFTCLQYKSFENNVGKGEIDGGKDEIAPNKHFFLFPQCFLPVLITFHHFNKIWNLSSANSFSLEDSRICHMGKGYCITKQFRLFMILRKKGFQNIMGKEKMLVISIFSFSHNVQELIKDKFHHLFVTCKCFPFGLPSEFIIHEEFKQRTVW